MMEWSAIKCTNCDWEGTEEITNNETPGCPDCQFVEYLVYKSDGQNITIPENWLLDDIRPDDL